MESKALGGFAGLRRGYLFKLPQLAFEVGSVGLESLIYVTTDILSLGPLRGPTKETTMANKHYVVAGRAGKYDTYEAAEEYAKRNLTETDSYGRNRPAGEVFIYESVASVKAPVPEAVVTKF